MGVFDRRSAERADEGPRRGGDGDGKAARGSRLGSWIGRGGGLVASVAGSVKEASRSALLKQALDARDRGNLGAAFHLVREESGLRPDDDAVAGAFWDIALAYERPDAAAEAIAGLIRRGATQGALELSAQYWTELHDRVPGALLDPATFARLIPQLAEQTQRDRAEAAAEQDTSPASGPEPSEAQRQQREERVRARAARESALASALRGVVDERNSGLSIGLAFRVAELARDLDPETALRAARFAVAAEDLDETKRRRLHELIAELDPDAPARPAPAAEPEVDEDLPAAAETDGSEIAAIETEPIPDGDPARNHPMRVVSPPTRPLSDAEAAALQARLPPSRTPATPGPALDASAVVEAADEARASDEPESVDAAAARAEAQAAAVAETEPDVASGTDAETGTDAGIEIDVDRECDAETAAAADAEAEGDDEPDVDFGGSAHPLDVDDPDDLLSAVESAPARDDDSSPSLVFEVPPDDSIVIDATSPPFDVEQPAPGAAAASVAAMALFSDLKAVSGNPLELDAERLVLAMPDGRTTVVRLERVQAIAVAEVAGLADTPVVVIDLALDWRSAGNGPLRTIRLRSDALNAAALAPGIDDPGDALRSVLTALMERTRAIPLPDPDAALGLMIPAFASVAEYEREVLQVAR